MMHAFCRDLLLSKWGIFYSDNITSSKGNIHKSFLYKLFLLLQIFHGTWFLEMKRVFILTFSEICTKPAFVFYFPNTNLSKPIFYSCYKFHQKST